MACDTQFWDNMRTENVGDIDLRYAVHGDRELRHGMGVTAVIVSQVKGLVIGSNQTLDLELPVPWSYRLHRKFGRPLLCTLIKIDWLHRLIYMIRCILYYGFQTMGLGDFIIQITRYRLQVSCSVKYLAFQMFLVIVDSFK